MLSVWTAREAQFAIQAGKPVVPVMCRPEKCLPAVRGRGGVSGGVWSVGVSGTDSVCVCVWMSREQWDCSLGWGMCSGWMQWME